MKFFIKVFIVGALIGALFIVLFIAVGEFGAAQTNLAEAQRLQALAEVERVRGETAVAITNARTDAFNDKIMVFSVAMNTPLVWLFVLVVVGTITFFAGYRYGITRPFVTKTQLIEPPADMLSFGNGRFVYFDDLFEAMEVKNAEKK